MTPWQLVVRLESFHEIIHAEHKSKLWHSWHLAMFSRAKTLPNLKKLLADKKEQSKVIDESDILRRFKFHNDMQKESK